MSCLVVASSSSSASGISVLSAVKEKPTSLRGCRPEVTDDGRRTWVVSSRLIL